MSFELDNFDSQMQKEIIFLLLTDEIFAHRFYKHVSQDRDLKKDNINIFTNKFNNIIYKAFISLYESADSVIPTKGVIRNFVSKLDLSSSEIESLKEHIEDVYAVKIGSKHFHEKECFDLLKKVKTLSFYNEFSKVVRSDDRERLTDFNADAGSYLEELNKISFSDDKIIKMDDIWETILEGASVSAKNIPSSIDGMNDVLNYVELSGGKSGGGYARGELSLIMGGTNSGKSLVCICESANALKNNMRVIHINLEGKKEQAPMRYVSNLANIPLEKLKACTRVNIAHGSLEKHAIKEFFTQDEIERIDEAQRIMSGRLTVIHDVDFDSKIEDLYQTIKELHNANPVDLIVIDGGTLLYSIKRTSGRYEELEYIFNKISKMAMEFGIAIITTVQTNRDGIRHLSGDDLTKKDNELPVLSKYHVGDCLAIAKVAGAIIGINRTPQEEKTGKTRYNIIKQREGAVGYCVGIENDQKTCSPTRGPIYYKQQKGFSSKKTNKYDVIDNISREEEPNQHPLVGLAKNIDIVKTKLSICSNSLESTFDGLDIMEAQIKLNQELDKLEGQVKGEFKKDNTIALSDIKGLDSRLQEIILEVVLWV